jgi:arylsulfatase
MEAFMPAESSSVSKPSRRTILRAGLAGLSLTALKAPACAGASKQRPNILLIMADQFRADCVGAEGNKVIRTPNLDSLASRGVRFRTAYTSVPSCTPARAGLLTGWSPWRHGMLGYGQVAEKYENEMPRMLAAAGYYAAGIGKMHWHPQVNTHGFEQVLLDESGRVESPGFISDYRKWFKSQAPDLDTDATGIGWNDYAAKPYALPEDLHPTKWTGDRAVEFLRDYERKEPLFLKVSFARPHSPYDPPERLYKKYEAADLPSAAVGTWAERNAQRGAKLPSDTWRGDLGADQVRRSRQGYYGSITFIDEQVGRILQALDSRGWSNNTLILFTADHGDMLGDHHLWRKTYAYEGSARIPMILSWPEGLGSRPPAKALSKPVELRDILPTFLEAAGVPVKPGQFDGGSLLGLALGRHKGWREYIDLEHNICYSSENNWNALTDGKYKYVYHATSGTEQLFDLKKDPGELKDLAGDSALDGVLLLWRGRMIKHLEPRGDKYVKDGKLVPRPQGQLYSPNYPGTAR